MKSSTGLLITVVLAAAGVAGYKAYRRMPPYELGYHNAVVQAGTGGGATGPHIGNCPIFPADNVWNTPIDKLAKDQRSSTYIDSIGPMKKVHPDFGQRLDSGIPFSEVPAGTRPVELTFEYHEDSDPGRYPIWKDVPIEGMGGDGDRHALLIDPQRCLLYEVYHLVPHGDGWQAVSGIKMDLTSNALRPMGWTSADAAGLPILPGLVRYDEVASGEIDHALRFTLPKTQKVEIWPARHHSGIADTSLAPMGMRFRLRADFDVSKYSKTNQVIMVALKKYGMFVADNGGAMYLSGVPDKRWDDSDLHKLGDMLADDFEAVDEAPWQMLPDSARVDPTLYKK